MRSCRSAAMLLVAALVGLAASLATTAHAESSPSAYGSRLVQLINDARAQHGLRALTVTSGTSTVAANWTQHLAAAQALSHNPNLGPQLESHGSADWTAYGENVGDGMSSSADQLFNAYMNSPEHRDNILNRAYRYLGVGVVFTGSTAWNTLDFVDEYATTHTTTQSSTSTQPSTTQPSTPTRSSTTHSSTPQSSTPRVTHQTTTRVAARSSVRPSVRHTTHVAAKPAVRHAAATPHAPKAAPAPSAAVPSSTPPVAVDAASHTVPVAAAMPSAVRLPGTPRNERPILVAVAVLAIVAVRFAHALRPAAA